MSHFLVLCFGDDVDGLLAPYNEELRVAPRREHLDEDDLARMQKHYETDDPRTLIEKMEDWNGGKGGIDAEGLYYLSNTNPNGKWDWYTVGGRWRGYLKAKPGQTGRRGDFDTFDRLAQQKGEPVRMVTGYDVLEKQQIDVPAMEADGVAKATERWTLYAAVTKHTKPNRTWDAIRSAHADIEAARAEYAAQPRVAAIHADPKVSERLIGFMGSPDEFLCGQKAFIARARLESFCPFACIIDGEWRERGSMGWWGCVSNENRDWPAEFRAMWKSVPRDTPVTVVDCHV
jgi:hypothetical protein